MDDELEGQEEKKMDNEEDEEDTARPSNLDESVAEMKEDEEK